MKNKSTDEIKKAKNCAFLLLKFRPRSEKEIYQRLKKKKFNEDIIKKIIAFLKDKNFIDDNYFAKDWIQLRLRRPWGLRRIREELKLKGIDKEIIDIQIEKVKESYSQEDIVLGLAKERINKLREIEPRKAKARVFAYLVRRGFSVDVVIDVVNQL